MSKRGNYFIAMYDKNDNYICDFNSIEECALYFNYSKKNMNNYILRGYLIKDEYKLFKIDNFDIVNSNKSL